MLKIKNPLIETYTDLGNMIRGSAHDFDLIYPPKHNPLRSAARYMCCNSSGDSIGVRICLKLKLKEL